MPEVWNDFQLAAVVMKVIQEVLEDTGAPPQPEHQRDKWIRAMNRRQCKARDEAIRSKQQPKSLKAIEEDERRWLTEEIPKVLKKAKEKQIKYQQEELQRQGVGPQLVKQVIDGVHSAHGWVQRMPDPSDMDNPPTPKTIRTPSPYFDSSRPRNPGSKAGSEDGGGHGGGSRGEGGGSGGGGTGGKGKGKGKEREQASRTPPPPPRPASTQNSGSKKRKPASKQASGTPARKQNQTKTKRKRGTSSSSGGNNSAGEPPTREPCRSKRHRRPTTKS